ncbi:MAG: CBS domain-containing protein [Peptococcaceae bacterium]|nr:CBS domain-containing protein [Peptococcaceae bacterium]
MLAIGKIMDTSVAPILASQTIGEITPIMQRNALPGLPVVDKNRKLLGVVFSYSQGAELAPETPVVK